MTVSPASSGGASSSETPPLDRPYYRAPFGVAIGRFFRKYVTFSGRAGRAEYWWAALLTTGVPFLLQVVRGVATGDWSVVDGLSFDSVTDALAALFGIATFLPGLAITWRRLHDTGRSGAWAFIAFVPVVGWIWIVVLLLLPSDPAGCRYDRPYRLGRRDSATPAAE